MNDFEKKFTDGPESSSEDKEWEALEDFRNRRVPEIVAEAKQSGRGGHFGDLFDPSQLDKKDMELYSRFEKLDKTSDLHQFIQELRQQAMALKGSNNGSKKDWISYILSRIQEDIDIRK